MKEITIRDRQGAIRLITDVNSGDRYCKELMADEYILLKFASVQPVNIQRGDYIETEYGRFEVIVVDKPTYNAQNGAYVYEQHFHAPWCKWRTRIFKFYTDTTYKETSFVLTQTPQYFLELICRNLEDNGFGKYIFSYDTSLKEMKTITFDSVKIDDALNKIAEAWDTEWFVDGNKIFLSKCIYGTPIPLSVNEALRSMQRQDVKDKDYVTRLYAFGSDKNLPTNYRPENIAEGVVQKMLHLPNGIEYVDAWENMAEEDVVEGIAIFSNIFPRFNGVIATISTKEYSDEDGSTTNKTWKAYRFTDSGVTFSDEYRLPGKELKITFQSGKLAGMTFDVVFNPDKKKPEEQIFEIIRNDENGIKLPSETMSPGVGDTYILSGFDTKYIDDTLLAKASEELLAEAQKTVKDKSKEKFIFTCETDAVWCGGYRTMPNGDTIYQQPNEIDLGVGQSVLITDVSDGKKYLSRVRKFEKHLDIKFDCEYVIGEDAGYTKTGELNDKIEALAQETKGYVHYEGGNGVTIIKRYDSTTPSDFNVYSALRQQSEFLSKQHDETTRFKINFVGGMGASSVKSIDADGNTTFEEGGMTGKGYGMYTKDGDTFLEIDNICVRKNFAASVIDIQKETFSAGNINLSGACGTVFRVYAFDDTNYNYVSMFSFQDKSNRRVTVALYDKEKNADANPAKLFENASSYKLFFIRTDGNVSVDDIWHNGDMALSKDLNLIAQDMHAWHRVVTSHGVEMLEDGKEYNYIVVSNSKEHISVTAEDGTIVNGVMAFDTTIQNSIPRIGDKVIQYGSVTEEERMGVTRLDSRGNGHGGVYVYMGIGKRKGTPIQFKPTSEPIVLTPAKTKIAADEVKILTRDGNGNIIGEKDFGMYKILISSYRSVRDALTNTCSTTFEYSVVNSSMTFANKMTVNQIKGSNLVVRGKKNTDVRWREFLLPSDGNMTDFNDEGMYMNYPGEENAPTSITLQLYDRINDAVYDEYVIPIVVPGTNGKDGTSVSIKGHAVAVLDKMSEFDALTNLDNSGAYLVNTNEASSTNHWTVKFQQGAWVKEQAVVGDGYIDVDGYLWVAIDRGWQNAGKISGNDGVDGADAVTVVFSPSSLILTERKKNADYEGLTTPVSVSVRVGEKEESVTITNIRTNNSECSLSISAKNVFRVTSVKDDITRTFVMVDMVYGDVSITQRFDIYINRLGSWSFQAMNDTMKMIAVKGFTYIDENGIEQHVDSLSTIQQSAREIATRVEEVNSTLDNKIERKYSEIKQTTDEISLKVGNEGGRNLLEGTKHMYSEHIARFEEQSFANYLDFATAGVKLLPNDGREYIDLFVYSKLHLMPGTFYTMSFMYRGNGFNNFETYIYNPSLRVCEFVKNNQTNSETKEVDGHSHFTTSSSEWKLGTVQFKTTNEITDKTDVTVIIGRVRRMSVVNEIVVCAPKIEYGTRATAWRPHDNDATTQKDLLDTGISIRDKKITITSNNVVIQNNKGEKTVLVDENGKITAALIDAVKMVAEVLVSQHLVANDIIIGGKSQLGQFTTDAEGHIINNALRDAVQMELGINFLSFKQILGEKLIQFFRSGFFSRNGFEIGNYIEMNESVNALQRLVGLWINVEKSAGVKKGMPNIGCYIENGVTVGLRPNVTRYNTVPAGGNLRLSKDDFYVVLNIPRSAGNVNVWLPSKSEIQHGQRVEIRNCTGVSHTIMSDAKGGVNGDGLSNAAGIPRNSLKIFVYDELEDMWWINTLN